MTTSDSGAAAAANQDAAVAQILQRYQASRANQADQPAVDDAQEGDVQDRDPQGAALDRGIAAAAQAHRELQQRLADPTAGHSGPAHPAPPPPVPSPADPNPARSPRPSPGDSS